MNEEEYMAPYNDMTVYDRKLVGDLWVCPRCEDIWIISLPDDQQMCGFCGILLQHPEATAKIAQETMKVATKVAEVAPVFGANSANQGIERVYGVGLTGLEPAAHGLGNSFPLFSPICLDHEPRYFSHLIDYPRLDLMLAHYPRRWPRRWPMLSLAEVMA